MERRGAWYRWLTTSPECKALHGSLSNVLDLVSRSLHTATTRSRTAAAGGCFRCHSYYTVTLRSTKHLSLTLTAPDLKPAAALLRDQEEFVKKTL